MLGGQSPPSAPPPREMANFQRLAVRLDVVLQTADLLDLHPEGLQPGEQPVQRRLVPERSVHHGLHLLHGRGEPFEVEQSLRGKGSRYPNLIVEGFHRMSSQASRL